MLAVAVPGAFSPVHVNVDVPTRTYTFVHPGVIEHITWHWQINTFDMIALREADVVKTLFAAVRAVL